MSFPFSHKIEGKNTLPDGARAALEDYPRIQPEVSFNRAVIESLNLEKMRRRSTLIGRIEEFLGLGLWQFAGSSALGALLPVVILGSMLVQEKPTSGHSCPPPIPDPLNLNYYGPLYAREIFQNQKQFSQPLPIPHCG